MGRVPFVRSGPCLDVAWVKCVLDLAGAASSQEPGCKDGRRTRDSTQVACQQWPRGGCSDPQRGWVYSDLLHCLVVARLSCVILLTAIPRVEPCCFAGLRVGARQYAAQTFVWDLRLLLLEESCISITVLGTLGLWT